MLAARTGGSSVSRLIRNPRLSTLAHIDEYPTAESSRYASSSSRRYLSASQPAFDATTASGDNSPQKKGSRKGSSNPRKRSPRSAAQIETAQSVAQALKQASLASGPSSVTHTFNPPEPTPGSEEAPGLLQTPADYIDEILLGDPPRSSRLSPESDFYRKKYKAAFDRIHNAFLLDQLRPLVPNMVLKNLGTARHKVPKMILIQQIMLARGWTVPQKPRSQRLAEQTLEPTVRQLLDLPENELFLFLRDARVVGDLVINKGITFSVVPAPAEDGSDPARSILSAESTEEQLAFLENVLKARRRHMITMILQPENIHFLKPSSGLMQFVSSATGAFVESCEDGAYRISSMDPTKPPQAERLLQIAALRSQVLRQSRGLTVISPTLQSAEPDSPDYLLDTQDRYSILPFFPSTSMIVPWDSLSESFGTMSYRLRRVTTWAPKAGKREAAHRDEALEDAPVVSLGEVRITPGDHTKLGSLVESLLPDDQPGTVTLTFGHFLMQNPEGSSPLSPPVKGQWPFSESQAYLDTAPASIFNPALTPLMIHHQLDSPPRQIRRLRYRTLDGRKVATFSYTYPAQELPTVEVQKNPEEEENWLIQLDKMLREVEDEDRNRAGLLEQEDKIENLNDGVEQKEETMQAETPAQDGQIPETSTETEGSQPEPAEPEAEADVDIVVEHSDVREVDVMMPDRPVDCRMTISTDAAAELVPPLNIRTFFQAVASSQPPSSETPLPKKGTQLTAPISLTLPDSDVDATYFLERDEYLEIAESRAQGDDVVLRSVHSRDMVLQVNRTVAHAELVYAGKQLPTRFWKEFANVTKDVGAESANVASGKDGRGLFL